jgi:hypothetical protein
VIVPFDYSKASIIKTNEVFFIVCESNYPNRYGLFNSSGKQILPCWYKTIYSVNQAIVRSNFNESIRTNEFWIIDGDGKQVGGLSSLDEPFTKYHDVAIMKKNTSGSDKYGIINDSLKVIVPFEYKELNIAGKDNQFIIAKTDDNKYVVFNREGVIIGEKDYDYAAALNYTVKVRKQNKYGLIDVDKVIFPCEYNDISWFGKDQKLGLFIVKKDNKKGIMNIAQKLIIPCDYDDISETSIDKYFLVKKGESISIIDTLGSTIIPSGYKTIEDAKNGLFVVGDGKTVAIYDNTGKMVLPFGKVSSIKQFNNNMAKAISNGLWGYINSKGEIAIPFKYTQAWDFDASGKATVIEDTLFWGQIDVKGKRVSANKFESSEYLEEQKTKKDLPYVYTSPKKEFTIRLPKAPTKDDANIISGGDKRMVSIIDGILLYMVERVEFYDMIYQESLTSSNSLLDTWKKAVIKSQKAEVINEETFKYKNKYPGVEYIIMSNGQSLRIKSFQVKNIVYSVVIGHSSEFLYPSKEMIDRFFNTLSITEN